MQIPEAMTFPVKVYDILTVFQHHQQQLSKFT